MAAPLLLAACGNGVGSAQPDDSQAALAADSALTFAAPLEGGGVVHLVRMVARGDHYEFEPERLRIRPGDVIRFVHTSYQPESVAFDSAGSPPGAAEVLRGQGAFAGPLLTQPGAVWEVRFRGAPPGAYPFVSVPHGAFGMRGVVEVQ